MSLKKILFEISENKITSTIKKVREEFINNGTCSYKEINNGECILFASKIEKKLPQVDILSTEMFYNNDTYTKNLWKESGDKIIFNYWSKRMLDRHGYPDKKMLKKDPPTHEWIFYKGKYYDAEEPNGVESPWDLPIFKRKNNWY